MKNLYAKFIALPRSMQWAAFFLVGLVVYFGLVETVLDSTNALNLKADSLATGLKQEAELLSPESTKGRILSEGRRLFGEPMLPGDVGSRPEAVRTAIVAILKKHGVEKSVTNERWVPFRGDELTNLLGSSAGQKTAERMIIDIVFDAPQDEVAAIVSELEQAKEIALISRVELRKPDAGRDAKSGAPVSTGHNLKVTITPEAWIVTAAAGGAQ